MKRIFSVLISLIMISFCCLLTANAEIIEHHNETLISINDHVTIKNYESGGINFREIALSVTNNSSDELKNIKYILLSISNESTITKNEITIDTLPSGATLTSQGVCSYNIESDLIDQSEVKFTWQVEYDNSAQENHVDEILIGEAFAY